MSTEDQQYSIANQQATIRTYCATNGFVVVATYKDSGKSGVAIQGREGLTQLLRDVMSGEAPFSSVLVYDVSRWGRFQDVDEAARYEFLLCGPGFLFRLLMKHKLERKLDLKSTNRPSAAEKACYCSNRTGLAKSINSGAQSECVLPVTKMPDFNAA